ncbi:MAG: fibronectin type III domain-containing protein [Eubacteriaceae bacterium]|nr:fibronectin type III domain-containing protein [Eubacteriaceae bacterium]
MDITCSKRNKIIAVILTLAMVMSCFGFMQTATANAASGKSPATAGTNIKNAVFYIAVDADNNGTVTGDTDKIYYYTLDEIKAYGDQVGYHYGNHGEGETAAIKGAKLSNMISDLKDVTVDEDWMIQYAEEDAFHATQDSYKDTVKSLTDTSSTPKETIIGYQCKMTYDKPDANNVNDTQFYDFTTFVEPSLLRAYRQTNSANSSVLKNFMGVVISKSGKTLKGDSGYTEKSMSDDDYGMQVADDKDIYGVPTGMRWPARPRVDLAYAKLSSKIQSRGFNGVSVSVKAAEKAEDQTVEFYWTETPYFKTNINGTAKSLLRSELINGSAQVPAQPTASPNKYWGYNKPMYVRYNGQWLKDLLTVPAGQKAYVIKADGSMQDITASINNYFVAYSYQQSKRSSNIWDYNRKTVNYDHSVLVDTTSAKVEASDGDSDYTPISGKEPTLIENAKAIITVGNVAAPSVKKAVKVKKRSAKLRWKKASSVTGYQVRYGRNKKITKSKKTVTIKSGKTVSKTVKKLKKNKKYYFKVRSYKKIEGKTFYSSWSKTKSFKTKKK